MRAIVLASAALVLCLPLTACDKAPSADGVFGLFSEAKTCRKPNGRFAKKSECTACPNGTLLWTAGGAECPPPPPPAEEPDPDATKGLKAIASNFDINLAVSDAGIPGYQPAPPSERQGAFRFICGAGQLSYDDPVVYPGQPGKSHLHQYYGNLTANAFSTYASLRAAGDSTCNHTGLGVAANRSAYWMPGMLDGKGNVVIPDYVQVYYKRDPEVFPSFVDASYVSDCQRLKPLGTKCIGIPNGIRFIQGFNMALGKPGGQPGHFKCVDLNDRSGPVYPDMASLKADPMCVPGNRVAASIASGRCWNGEIDAPDHMGNVVGMIRNAGTGWQNQCPGTHQFLIPQFTITAFYTIGPDDDLSIWQLSSDHMFPDLPHGSTLHFDYFEAWDALVKDMWVDACLNGYRNSNAGNLCGGRKLVGGDIGTVKTLAQGKPTRVPVPARS